MTRSFDAFSVDEDKLTRNDVSRFQCRHGVTVQTGPRCEWVPAVMIQRAGTSSTASQQNDELLLITLFRMESRKLYITFFFFCFVLIHLKLPAASMCDSIISVNVRPQSRSLRAFHIACCLFTGHLRTQCLPAVRRGELSPFYYVLGFWAGVHFSVWFADVLTNERHEDLLILTF